MHVLVWAEMSGVRRIEQASENDLFLIPVPLPDSAILGIDCRYIHLLIFHSIHKIERPDNELPWKNDKESLFFHKNQYGFSLL